mmetsp:Transcript_20715/g.35592  ORF Transcript_20715/g.35592 Transcript_20715/m.35592 type:complete len:95 (+) Transcript_20715:621-905(+)
MESKEEQEPKDLHDLELNLELLDLALFLALENPDISINGLIFSDEPSVLQSPSSPIDSQLALLDDKGSHKNLLRLWLQGNASITCLIHPSISGQ